MTWLRLLSCSALTFSLLGCNRVAKDSEDAGAGESTTGDDHPAGKDLPWSELDELAAVCANAANAKSCDAISEGVDCLYQGNSARCECAWVLELEFENSESCGLAAKNSRCRPYAFYPGGFGCPPGEQVGSCEALQQAVMPASPDGAFSAAIANGTCGAPAMPGPTWANPCVDDDASCACLDAHALEFCTSNDP